MKAGKPAPPIPPREMLEEEFMKPLLMSRAEVGRRLAIPENRVSQIIKGRRAITPDTALRLEALFGRPAAYWLLNQAEYDFEKERRTKGARVRKEVRRASA